MKGSAHKLFDRDGSTRGRRNFQPKELPATLFLKKEHLFAKRTVFQICNYVRFKLKQVQKHHSATDEYSLQNNRKDLKFKFLTFCAFNLLTKHYFYS